MHDILDQFSLLSLNDETITYHPASPTLMQAADTAILSLTTCTGIVLARSPVNTLLINLSQGKSALPPYSGNAIDFGRALYAGTFSSLLGSLARITYVTASRKNAPVFSQENASSSWTPYYYPLCVAFGDILLTQVPDSISQLKKVPGLAPYKFYTPHNLSQLIRGGFMTRYCASTISFVSLLTIQPLIADNLPIQNPTMKHFTAGILSGATAAFFTYPFSTLRDYTLVQATVTYGQLNNKKTSVVLKELKNTLQNNPEQTINAAVNNAKKQLFFRMGLSGFTFAIITAIGEKMGPKPLTTFLSREEPLTSDNPHLFFKIETKAAQSATHKSQRISSLFANPFF